jgi:hypothetical protein
MTLGKAAARVNKTFMLQTSLMIVTYNHQYIFIVQPQVVKNTCLNLNVVKFSIRKLDIKSGIQHWCPKYTQFYLENDLL